MTEAELLKAVRQLATLHQWKLAHFADSRRSFKDDDGTERFVGDTGAKGWPDCVAVKGSRILIAELKREGAKPTPEQIEWLDALMHTPVECHIWFPADLKEIAMILSSRERFSSPTDWRRRRDQYVRASVAQSLPVPRRRQA